MTDRDTLDVLHRAAVWFEANPDGFGPLLDAIGDARLVLIGEASHGTHEFYRPRGAHEGPGGTQIVSEELGVLLRGRLNTSRSLKAS